MKGEGTALRDLESNYKSKWRSVAALRTKWNIRRTFYTAIEALIIQGDSEEIAVAKPPLFEGAGLLDAPPQHMGRGMARPARPMAWAKASGQE